jgi:hypothetical protein
MSDSTRKALEQLSDQDLAWFASNAAGILSMLQNDPTESEEERASWARLANLSLQVLQQRQAAAQGGEPSPGKERGGMSDLRGEPASVVQERRRWMPLLTAAVEQPDDLLGKCALCIWTAWTHEREASRYVRSLWEHDGPPIYGYWRLAACQQALLDALDAWGTVLVELTTRPDAVLWPGAPAHALATYRAACQEEIRRCRTWAYRVQEAFLKQIEGKRVLFRFADPLLVEEAEGWDQ